MSGVPDVSGEPGPADMGGEPALPDGFLLGHWTDPDARTGCTVVLAPPGTRGSVDVRGGGTGTRELENLSPLANAEGPSAVLLTGGSAFGLAAADGVVRWLEERGTRPPHPRRRRSARPDRGRVRSGRRFVRAAPRSRRGLRRVRGGRRGRLGARAGRRRRRHRGGQAVRPRSGHAAVGWATPPRAWPTERLSPRSRWPTRSAT